MLRKIDNKLSIKIDSFNSLYKQVYYIAKKLHNFSYIKKVNWFNLKYSNGVPIYIEIFINHKKLFESSVKEDDKYVEKIIYCITQIIDNLNTNVLHNKKMETKYIAQYLQALTEYKNHIKNRKIGVDFDRKHWDNIILNFISLYGNNI